MRYVKKTCILRQLKNGFSADGKSLSGIVKAEQYAANLGIEVSTVNLAPISAGEYYLVIADREKRYKLLPFDGQNRFSLHTDMQIAEGFYAVLCFVKASATPIAYGVCGALPYDIFTLVRRAFSTAENHNTPIVNADLPPTNPEIRPIYDDEMVANDNYYEQENTPHANDPLTQSGEDAPLESGDPHQGTPPRHDADENANDESVRHAFGTESDGYYQSIKGELSALFARYPEDETLTDAYPASEWVRVKGEAGKAEELVGLIYESGMVKYVCYAVPATDDAPQEIRDKAYFVPVSPLTPEIGFYVLYQSAATGESILKKEI